MANAATRCLLISDFNLANLAAQLRNEGWNVVEATYGQVVPILLDGSKDCWSPAPDLAVVWTRPEAVLPSFQRILNLHDVPLSTLLSETESFARTLLKARKLARVVLVPQWASPSFDRGLGLMDLRPGGIAYSLQRANVHLSEVLSEASNVFALDTSKWIASAGPHAFSPKFWYMAKIPFGQEVFRQASRDIDAAGSAISGRTRKVIVLDLDDTLWGGIVGDVGWEGLRLGGHDPIGEGFLDFQQALKTLQRRGIVLSIVSKNEESVALEAIDRHPEMVLRRDDFVRWRINWMDKAQNVVELLDELNLGLDSAVFIDDNPAERARVRETLPEVLVPEWPPDKMLYASTLRGLRCFDSASRSGEDAKRTRMYVADRHRTGLRKELGSIEDWLRTLDLKVRVEPLSASNLQRASQLLNRTNQMNLATRRLTPAELKDWASKPQHEFWTLRVGDRFGESGLTGLVGLVSRDDRVSIVDFVLSCRVFGRHIENVMAHLAVRHARRRGVSAVEATYLPTEKNKPCLEFWTNSGFIMSDGTQTFVWDATHEYPLPAFIALDLVDVP